MIKSDSVGKSLMETVSITGLESIQSMVYNIVKNSLVLKDSNFRVFEFDLESKTLRNVTNSRVENAHEMDIDLVGENIYWMDKTLNMIETTSIRTGAHISLTRFGIENVTAFSIAPENGSLILATAGMKGNIIYKAPLDGKVISSIRRLGKEKTEPIFSIDKHTGRIYWLNEKSGMFDSLSSTGNKEIAVVGEENVPKFALSEHNTLYFVPKDRVVGVAKYKGFMKYTYKLEVPNEEISRVGSQGRTLIALVNKTISHELWDLRHNHECSSKSIRKKNCSDICIVADGFRGTCHCPHGLELGEDMTKCIEVKLHVCDENQFKCNDNKCIKQEFLCDGVPDCVGEDDETICKDQIKCPKETFHCGRAGEKGMCIPKAWKCDNEIDCEDASDEKSCVKDSCKAPSHYCEATDQCVQKSWICALRYTCPGVDTNQFCNGYYCSSSYFVCANLSNCIYSYRFCDGRSDCSDGSDEPPEYCKKING